jgi:tetratricopeptide (TPR) repeat protein
MPAAKPEALMGSARKTKERPAARVSRPASTGLWWQYALAIFGALFVAFQAYGPTLRAPLLFDDGYLPFALPYFGESSLRTWLSGVRPALMLGYWINYQISGMETFSYHVVNVLFHVLNSGLVFLIARKILDLAGQRERRTLLAAFAAGLFLLHPVQTESVAYVASRSENQSALFYYGAFALFLYRRAPAISWRTAAAVLGLSVAALATKEHTVTLPALLLLTDYFWNPGFSLAGIRRNWRIYVPGVLGGAALGAYVAFSVLRGALSAGFGMKDVAWHEYLLTQFAVFFHYARLFVLPVNLNIDYDHPFARSLLDGWTLLWLALLIACGAAAWIWRRRYPLACYGFFTVLILLLPTSSVLPIRDPIAERRMYLPMIGYLFIALDVVRRLRIKQRALATGLGAVLVVAAAGTYLRNQVWAGPIPLWEDTVRKSPNKRRPRFQLAFAYYEAGRCADAVREYDHAAKLEPPDYELLVDWALAYQCLRQPERALDKLRQAALIQPGAHVYSTIAMIHADNAEWQDALTALSTAERLNPAYATTYVYRGNVYLATGRPSEAVREFERALALEPQNPAARSGLVSARQSAPAR